MKRDYDFRNAIFALLNWTDAIIIYKATEVGNTEDNDVEDEGLRHATNTCNVFFMDIETDECVAHASRSRIYEVLNGEELNKGLDNMATDMTTKLDNI